MVTLEVLQKMTTPPPQKKEREKKSNNLEYKLETCSKIPCPQEEKQLDAYCIFIKGVSPATKPTCHSLPQWKEDWKYVRSTSKCLCGAAPVRLEGTVSDGLMWFGGLADLVWLWLQALSMFLKRESWGLAHVETYTTYREC